MVMRCSLLRDVRTGTLGSLETFPEKKFPNTKGWAYAAFDYTTASDKFTPDPTGTVNCGFACHTKVAAKDYIFTAYRKR